MRPLTKMMRAAIARAARAELAEPGSWIRSETAGDRVTLAALEARGLLERRPWRGDGISRDSAFEYRLAPTVLEAAGYPLRRNPTTETEVNA